MSKLKVILTFSTISIITFFFIIIGFVFNKSEMEKVNGLTEIYDVSSDDTIAYVSYNKGKPELYIKTGDKEKLALQLNDTEIILDIAFSPSENTLMYSSSDRDMKANSKSSINVLEIHSLETKTLYQTEGIITEIVFDPKDEQQIFFLKASTFENYSPIARENPHDFDIYSYDIKKDTETRHTNWKEYSIQSLNVSYSDNAVYIQMNDPESSSAEEIFDAKQKVYKVPLDNPEQLTVVSDENRDIDIFDFAILPDETGMIFQSISNWENGGTFQYELYYDDWEQNEETRLTSLKEYAGRPLITPDGNKIYFIVNKKFARKHPDNHIYSMGIDGENIEEVPLSNR